MLMNPQIMVLPADYIIYTRLGADTIVDLNFLNSQVQVHTRSNSHNEAEDQTQRVFLIYFTCPAALI